MISLTRVKPTRKKSPIQHQENYKSQENRDADQNLPVLVIPGHRKSSDCSLPIPHLSPRLSQSEPRERFRVDSGRAAAGCCERMSSTARQVWAIILSRRFSCVRLSGWCRCAVLRISLLISTATRRLCEWSDRIATSRRRVSRRSSFGLKSVTLVRCVLKTEKRQPNPAYCK
jgi:hypothetical protein